MPTVVSTSNTSSDFVGSGSLNIAYPSSITAGNLLLLFSSSRGAGRASDPSGFILWNYTDDGDTSVKYIWYRIADGTETGNIAISLSTGTFVEIVAVALNLSDASFNVSSINVSPYGSTSPKVCPNISSMAADMILRVAMSNGGTAYTIPSETTSVISVSSGGSQASHIDIASATGLTPSTGAIKYIHSSNTSGRGYTLVIEPSPIGFVGPRYIEESRNVCRGSISPIWSSDIGFGDVDESSVLTKFKESSVHENAFSNDSIGGVFKTFSLINTSSTIAYGGVIDSYGSVHWVPNNTNIGQKIDRYGTVNTYTLPYTTPLLGYIGGVLDNSGEIHFIPCRTQNARGLKISLNGAITTYALVYTDANDSYYGGVVSAKGEIHFIPHDATVGQKVIYNDTVSTYSLAYTVSDAYAGGVASPNGDVYFIPHSASVGQKIALDGTISTYSLVYTTSNAYVGGVLAPNGDIHFIPNRAAVGQKISIDNVVSTYSLIATYNMSGVGTDPYSGGVIIPSGEIHFIPSTSSIGQKITDGVVSTYSLPHTSINSDFKGGIVDLDGNIVFMNYDNTTVGFGMKLLTNSISRFGKSLCLSPFLNKF